jgi:hypothetical protein
MLHDVAETSDAEACAQERLGHRAERDPGRGLAGAGALEHRAGVVEAVLLHADEVGVPGRGRVSGALRARPSSSSGVDRVGGHHRLPLGPLGVADLDRHRPPWVRPCRTPPRNSTSSRSNFIRAPRP